MFERLHHQRIAKILEAMNADLLTDMQCFFGGGTAISLQLQEYRESVDIDFLCSSDEGYKKLRIIVFDDFDGLFKIPVKRLRDVRIEKNKVSTLLEIDGASIKIELFKEIDPQIKGTILPTLKVPTLSREDLYAQKLMANGDRGGDRHVLSRDIIDLAMMLQSWGDIPLSAWNRAYKNYGNQLSRAFHGAVGMILDNDWLATCLSRMKMDMDLLRPIQHVLESAGSKLPLNEKESEEQKQRIQNLLLLKDKGAVEHSLWKRSNEVLKSTRIENINWVEVENKVALDGFLREGLDFWVISDVITQHSPGAVSPYRQEMLFKKIERFAKGLDFSNDEEMFLEDEFPKPKF